MKGKADTRTTFDRWGDFSLMALGVIFLIRLIGWLCCP